MPHPLYAYTRKPRLHTRYPSETASKVDQMKGVPPIYDVHLAQVPDWTNTQLQRVNYEPLGIVPTPYNMYPYAGLQFYKTGFASVQPLIYARYRT